MTVPRHAQHGVSTSSGYSRYARGSAGHTGYRTAPEAGCETVYKRAEVDGRLATIEGTRCHDEHGEAYIVGDSRRVVEYHDDQ